MGMDSFIPYNVSFEETLMSVISSIIFKKIESISQKTRLENVIEKPQYGYTAASVKEPPGIKYVRITDIQAGQINWDSVPYCQCHNPEKYLLRENDILFARTGGTTGKSFIVKGAILPAVFASYLIRIRPKQGVNADFLYWFLQTESYWSQIKTKKIGSAQPNVNGNKLSSLTISVPDNEIQKDVADYLSAYRKGLLEKYSFLPVLPLILKTEERRILKVASVLNKIHHMGILRSNRILDKTSSTSKKLQENGSLYETASLMEEIRAKVFNPRNPLSPLITIKESSLLLNALTENPRILRCNSDFLYLDISGVEAKTGRILEVKKYKGCEAPSRARRVMKAGNVLISTVRPYLKSFAVVPPNLDNQICSTGFAVLTCSNDIDPQFLMHQFFSDFFVNQCTEKMRGAHYPAINTSELRECKLMFPPLPRQKEIAKTLDSLQTKIDKMKKLQTEIETEVKALTFSIINYAINRQCLR